MTSLLTQFKPPHRLTSQLFVRTECRVCGRPTLIGLPRDYRLAAEVAYLIDDRAMYHEDHYETGGWGVHWNMDLVLQLAFPQRGDEVLFPTPAWYPHTSNGYGIKPPVLVASKPLAMRPF